MRARALLVVQMWRDTWIKYSQKDQFLPSLLGQLDGPFLGAARPASPPRVAHTIGPTSSALLRIHVRLFRRMLYQLQSLQPPVVDTGG